MANNVGRIGVALALDSAEFVRGIEAAQRRLGEFVQKVEDVGRKGVMALAAMATAAIAFADEVYDVAKANDIAIETILNLQKALATSGGSAESAGRLISSFTNFVDKAATGSDEAQKSFARAGISLRDLGKMSTEELFKKAVAGIAAIEDPLTRNAKAMEVFGKAAKGVDFIDFNEGLQKTDALTKQNAQGIKQAAEMVDKFKNAILDLTATTASKLGPVLKETNDYLDSLFQKSSIVGDALKTVFETVSVVGINVVYVLKTMFGEAEAMINYVTILSTQGLNAANKANEEYIKKTIKQREELDQAERRILGIGNRNEENDSRRLDRTKPNFGRPIQESSESINRNNQALDETKLKVTKLMEGFEKLYDLSYKSSMKQLDLEIKRLSAIEKQQEVYDQTFLSLQQSERLQSRQLDLDRESLLLNSQFKNLRAEEIKYAQDILTIRAQYAEQEYQIKNVMNLRGEDETKALETNNALRDRAIQQAKEVLEISRQETEGSQQKGFGKGFDEFIRNMPNQVEIGKQSFNALMGSMDSALSNFVRSGKFNFKDFTRSLIQDMMLIQARAAMMNMMKGVYGFLGGGSPSVSLAEKVVSGFADGGSPPVNQPSIVGERGPELFVPRTAGTIIPNNQLASSMGGGQTINYNGPYIEKLSAIDTQSSIQFLSKNKQAVWAANQSMARSVPTSR